MKNSRKQNELKTKKIFANYVRSSIYKNKKTIIKI